MDIELQRLLMLIQRTTVWEKDMDDEIVGLQEDAKSKAHGAPFVRTVVHSVVAPDIYYVEYRYREIT